MLKKYQNSGFLTAVIIGIIAGAVSFTVLLLIFSFIVSVTAASEEKAIVFATVLISVTSFAAGTVSAKCAENKKLAVGITSGGLLYIISAVAAAVINGTGFSSLFFIRLLLCILMSSSGAVISAFKRPRGKMI